MVDKVSGNPNVFKEAAERKRGGKVKKGMKPDGAMAKMRMDRPRRASGGACGSDKNPFSSAHKAGK